jgi:hypothetical protein
MKNSLNFQKRHTADFLINSFAEPANNDKAFSNFLKNRKSKVKAAPSKKVLK